MKLTLEQYCRLQTLAESVSGLAVETPVSRDSLFQIRNICMDMNLDRFMYDVLIYEPDRIWHGRKNNWHWKLKALNSDLEIRSPLVSSLEN